MIFKKPYAFLIKNFKKINLLLTILTAYLISRSYNIISFFNNYIHSNYTGDFYAGFSNNYISSFVYFIIILTLLGIFGILLLFIYKKKPSKAYIASFVYYIFLFAFLIFIKGTLVTLESSVISAETARIYRDLSLISIMPQIVFFVLFLIRGFGFNIKKFNFQEDLKDLEISEEDSEEVEITINRDNTNLKRNFRRFIREFKVYLQENKFIVFLIIIGIIIGVIFLIYKSLPTIVDRNYNQGDSFVTKGVNYKVEDSIVTNLDYKGDKLADNKYYVVIKLYVENNTQDNYTIDFNDFRLDVNDRYIYPILDKGSYFIDYAKATYNTKLKVGENSTYALVYEITENDIKKNYELKINNGSAINDNLTIGKFNYVAVSPTILDKIVTVGNYNLGQTVTFNSSNLKNTTFMINNVEITDKYIYDYELCSAHICNTYKNKVNIDYLHNNKILLVMDYDYALDETAAFNTSTTSFNKFLDSFIKIRYVMDSKTVYDTVKNVTPTNLKDKLILEVNSNVKETNALDLVVMVRDKEYIIKIK